MQRVPEPELMDAPDQARAYAEADFSEPHDRFVAGFAERFPSFTRGRVVDLGCGPADVTIRFARAYPGARVVGFDAGPNMLRLGTEAVAAAGLCDRIVLERRHLPDPVLPGGFDAVVSNSLLHHLDHPRVLWDAVRQCAGADAAVFVMDLRRPPTDADARAMVDAYARSEPEVLRADFLHSLRAAYEPDEVRAQLAASGLAHLTVEEVGDRHLVAWGRHTPK